MVNAYGRFVRNVSLLALAAAGCVLVSARPAAAQALIYSNGPLATGETLSNGVAAPTGTQWSEIQNGNGTIGWNITNSLDYRVADDFTVPAGQRWTVSAIEFYSYNTNAPTSPSPFTAAFLQVWSGAPNAGGTVAFGDTTTNRLLSSTPANIYRTTYQTSNTARYVWKNVAQVDPPLVLEAGTYWIDWSSTVTSAASHYAPPVTIVGQLGATGANALQWQTTAWVALVDGASTTPQDFPFGVVGAVEDLAAPDAFAFTDQTGVARNTLITSDAITVTGNEIPAAVSCTCEFELNGDGTWLTTLDTPTVPAGTTIKVRQWSSNDYVTDHGCRLTVGGVVDEFNVTTLAAGAGVLLHQPRTGALFLLNQDFETANDARDLFVADDFTNADPWYLTAIFVPGVADTATGLTDASMITVQVYDDASGVPAGHPGSPTGLVYEASFAPTDAGVLITRGLFQGLTDVTLTLPVPERLPAGHYWVLVFPTLDLTVNIWALGTAVTTNGAAAQVINPGAGWSLPTVWTSVQDPSTYSLSRQDLAFRLDGQVEDLVPDAFAFVDQTGVALATSSESNAITVAGVYPETAISVTGGEYQIGAGSWTAIAGTVVNGASVKVRQTSSATCATTTDTVLTIGGVSDTFSVTTVACDATPDAFSFTDQTGVALATLTESNAITVAGINTTAAITVTGGEYQIGAGAWTATAGTVVNGDSVKVRQTSSATCATTTDTVLTIGGVADTFSVTTVACDATPDAFAFTDQTGVALSTVTESNAITVAGINQAAAIGVTGGEYQIDAGSWTSTAGTVTAGASVKVRLTSSASYSTAVDATLTIGGVSDTFSVTTVAAPQQDGGTTQQDGGATQQDGGATQQDGGATQQDGGATQQDSGAQAQADGPAQPSDDGGCGCRAAGGSDAPVVLFLAFLGLALLGRRSRRRS